MNILLKSAKIIDPANKDLHLKKRDIYIKNGVIESIAAHIKPTRGTQVMNLKNLHVSVGWFDSSVSFGEPGYEERETLANGLQVAGKSGYTDIILNPNTNPVPDSSGDIMFLKESAKNSATKIHPLGALTKKSEGKDLAELFDMKNAGAVGFYDYKSPLENANLLKIALQYAQNFEGLVFSYPMEQSIAGKGLVNEGEVSTRLGLKGIAAMAEDIQIARDLHILEYTGGALHIPTISSGNSISTIADAKKKGLDISCSVPIHNLWFTDDALEEFDSHVKVMPPLRTKKDATKLIKALENGTIDLVTTDHSPIDIEEKRIEFDNAAYGTIGLESAFGILNQLYDTSVAVGLLTKGRHRFGIDEPQIKKGVPANLTLFDPKAAYTLEKKHIHSTSKNSMFLNTQLKGKVYGVIAYDTINIQEA